MSFSSPNTVKVAIICAILSLPLACAGSDAHNNRHKHGVNVSISPTGATLQAGQSEQFTATVSGTSDNAVTWLVNGSVGGNSTVGSVSTSGLYVAPPNVPTTSIIVTARSAYQSSASASATVSVVSPPVVSVSISPTSATLQTDQSQQFSASVSGTTSTQVLWLINGVAGGSLSTGTVSATGQYTAPTSVPSVPITVTAQSTYSTAATASAKVTISAPVAHSVDLSWSPSTSTVAGYNVYRSTQSNGTYSRLNSGLETATVFLDSTVQAGLTYYYMTTAVDSNGIESGYSNVAQAVIP